MKTRLNLFLSILLLTGTATMALAGPSPDYWTRMRRPPAKPTATPSQPVAKPDSPGGLTCAYMLVPNTGGFSKVPYTTVRCTPDMMKNDRRCQQACAQARKG